MNGKLTRKTLGIVAIVLTLSLVLATPAYAYPAPVQIFYVTLPEADALTVLKTINGDAVQPVWTYFSIAIGVNGTLIYYDQWEDGYAADIANPTPAEIYQGGNPAGVQIWGNGTAADGCAPNIAGVALTCTDGNDVLNAGNVVVPYNSITIPRNISEIRFDAKDKIGASKSIAMTRATWASTSNTLNAFAHEMYATSEWGTQYEAPVGTNTANAGSMFEYSGLSVMASQNNTTVQIDADANGTYETSAVLQEGGSTLVGGTSTTGGIRQGAAVLADKPVQVVLVTGDVGSNYESRDMNLLPVSAYGSSYWSPVGVNTDNSSSNTGPVRLFLYNPSNTKSIYITCKSHPSYRDQFATQAYNNSNGTLNWSGQSWTEANDDGSASGGTIYINTGTGTLRFAQNSTTNDSIRRAANLSAYSNATLSFTLNGTDLEFGYYDNDRIRVQISSNGGTTWTDLQSFSSDPNGATYTYDVSAYIASNTTVRFVMVDALESGDSWDIDSINISVPSGVAASTQPVGTSGVVNLDLYDGEAAHCYASDSGGAATSDKIFAIGTMDTDGQAWDWSFTLFPDNFLSTDALVGLGLGQDPTLTYTENGNPLWVTAVCEGGTWVYVDWNNDGVADTVDTDGDGTAEAGSQNGVFVSYLQSVRLFDSSGGLYAQTGARVWSRTASGVGYGGTPGCKLAVAWGQDPRHATAGAPGLDVGTSVPPLRLVEGTKTVTYANDTSPVGVLNPGDRIYYNITIANTGSSLVEQVYLYDQVPAHLTYYPNSTEWGITDSYGTAIPDDGSGTPFPLDGTGGVYLGNLAAGGVFYARFQATLESLDSGDYAELTNCDTAFTNAGSFVSCVTRQVATRDWGDLPNTYGTAAAQNGPNHSWSGVTLGAVWDVEAQGSPSDFASGDDFATSDDEEGVSMYGAWKPGPSGGQFSVTAACPGGGCQFAFWLDWNGDGDFADAGENYVTTVNDGSQTITFDIPSIDWDDWPTKLYARFRIYNSDYAGAYLPTGFVAGGEVEDYLFSSPPTSVDILPFRAMGADLSIVLVWQTTSEMDNLGFNVYRSTSLAGERVKLNMELIPSLVPPGSPFGAAYEYADTTIRAGKTYYYWLEDVDISGRVRLFGPVDAKTIDRRGKELPPTLPAGE